MSGIEALATSIDQSMRNWEGICATEGHAPELSDNVLYLEFPYEHLEYDTPDSLVGVGNLFGVQGVRVGSKFFDSKPYHLFMFTYDQCFQLLAVLNYHLDAPVPLRNRSGNEYPEKEGSKATS